MGSKAQLLSANRHIRLHGPRNIRADVEYCDWWPNDAPYPCLYVGKAINLKNRFGQHLMRGTPGRAHRTVTENEKGKPKTIRPFRSARRGASRVVDPSTATGTLP